MTTRELTQSLQMEEMQYHIKRRRLNFSLYMHAQTTIFEVILLCSLLSSFKSMFNIYPLQAIVLKTSNSLHLPYQYEPGQTDFSRDSY